MNFLREKEFLSFVFTQNSISCGNSPDGCRAKLGRPPITGCGSFAVSGIHIPLHVLGDTYNSEDAKE